MQGREQKDFGDVKLGEQSLSKAATPVIGHHRTKRENMYYVHSWLLTFQLQEAVGHVDTSKKTRELTDNSAVLEKAGSHGAE